MRLCESTNKKMYVSAYLDDGMSLSRNLGIGMSKRECELEWNYEY